VRPKEPVHLRLPPGRIDLPDDVGGDLHEIGWLKTGSFEVSKDVLERDAELTDRVARERSIGVDAELAREEQDPALAADLDLVDVPPERAWMVSGSRGVFMAAG
jgi:hypothetical protein